MSTRTPDPSKVTAKQLHLYLDILVARFLSDTGKYVGKTTVLELMYWSHKQFELEKANAQSKKRS